MTQKLSHSLIKQEDPLPHQAFSSLLNTNLSKENTNPGQRINDIRLGVRKTIEFLNQPYVKYVLEQRGINVEEKLVQLRSRFTVLAKFPVFNELEANILIEKKEHDPIEYIEYNNELDGLNVTYLEVHPFSNEISE